jgi:hypothetical protein
MGPKHGRWSVALSRLALRFLLGVSTAPLGLFLIPMGAAPQEPPYLAAYSQAMEEPGKDYDDT